MPLKMGALGNTGLIREITGQAQVPGTAFPYPTGLAGGHQPSAGSVCFYAEMFLVYAQPPGLWYLGGKHSGGSGQLAGKN